MKMRWLALALVVLLPAAGAAEDERVRAKERTVVTVEDRAEAVETVAPAKRRSVAAKLGGAIRRGLGTFTGWLLNTGDDIPRERERKEQSDSKQ